MKPGYTTRLTTLLIQASSDERGINCRRQGSSCCGSKRSILPDCPGGRQGLNQ